MKNVDVKREDFETYQEYVDAFEEARQKEIARRSELSAEELVEEEEKLEEKELSEYQKYADEVARNEAIDAGVMSTEVMQITREQAASPEPQTNLGKKAVEDKKKAASKDANKE